ncbi:type II toxin-antitoxin system PemK/MazF family toxin [Microbacterium sp. GCS4]|uniref:type II toxin-antitoxin system PemK/MazF family toxin n=1 Tax=Microbacterium sp. GCS4 TaxID=1692239 RepID=UPI000ABF0CA6|nr:type II toxin-antitoxin system PemK/MazF family toxin [Microbacterium sp. GCS4]
MGNSNGILGTLAQILLNALGSKNRTPRTTTRPGRPVARVRRSDEMSDAVATAAPDEPAGSATIRVDPDRVGDVRIQYAPDRDGAPDAGEVIWTWVPYEEGDGRGKDRPVLVIGRHSASRVYAVRMTSKPHDRDRDYLPIGSGAWDSQGRESWVDIEQLYSVHETGLRREAAVLDKGRYGRVVEALTRRYGWARG